MLCLRGLYGLLRGNDTVSLLWMTNDNFGKDRNSNEIFAIIRLICTADLGALAFISGRYAFVQKDYLATKDFVLTILRRRATCFRNIVNSSMSS